MILRRLGREEEAVGLLETAHEVRTVQAPVLWERYKTQSVYGHALARLGQFEVAQEHLLNSIEPIRESRGPDHYRTAQALYRLVDLYERWGKPEEARRWRDQITPKSRTHAIVESTIGAALRGE